jgi:hypothetical protein
MIMLTRKKSSCFINPHKNGPFDSRMQNGQNMVCPSSVFSLADPKSEDIDKKSKSQQSIDTIQGADDKLGQFFGQVIK